MYNFTFYKGDHTDYYLKARFSKGLICPNCDCPDAIKYGKYKSIQRYRCCACGRTFTFKTNTFMARTHNVEKWIKYIECFKEGLTIRQCAKKVGISVPTAFTWRHKIMDAIKSEKPERFVGTVELIDKHFRVCEKGCRNLTRKRWIRSELAIPVYYRNKLVLAMDRYGNIIFKLINSHSLLNIKCSDDFFILLKSANKLVTSSSSEKKIFAQKLNVPRISTEFYYYNSDEHNDANLNRSNQRMCDLLIWMSKFHGVATKYLEKYVKWFELTMTNYDLNTRIIECLI